MKRTGIAIVALAAIASGPALAAKGLDLMVDSAQIDRDQNLLPHSYANMLDTATPAVVSVHTARIVRIARSERGLSPEEEMLRRFFGLPAPQYQQPQPNAPEPEERRMPQGVGSGVIVSPDGYIITNHHVVKGEGAQGADEILVKLNDGRELEAKIIGSDPLTDVAIIKVEATGLPTVRIADSDNIRVGDVVFAIGNPMGVGLTVTQGIVSATKRAIGIYGESGYESFIQTDASINPGNSGGALVDSKGRLVGINSAIISRTGGNIGIGFAIPANLALNISKQLADNGEVRRGFLGVHFSNVGPNLAEAFGLKDANGVLIDDVEEGAAADKGGMKRGDVVTSIDGKPVDTANDFRLRIGNSIPGTKVALGILRDGKDMTLDIEVGFAVNANELLEGVEVAMLDEPLAQQYRVPERVAGLVVTNVANSSPYAPNLRQGMVILEINDREITSISDARELLRSGVNKLYIFTQGRTGYLAVRIP